jgi:RNA polymerase sigma-70 factor (ECF subfamily)
LSFPLAKTFTQHQPQTGEQVDPKLLESTLEDLIQQAHQRWPTLRGDGVEFTAYLAERMLPERKVAEWLGSVHAADLFLCSFCARGDSAALEIFDRTFLTQVVSAIAAIQSAPAFIAEVQQQMRQKLLVSSAERPAKIAEYAGFGPLSHWLRAVAVRTALNLRRTQNREDFPVADEVLLDLPVRTNDLELDYLKSRYRTDFTEAFRKAVSSLTSQERNILRLHFVDGLSLSQVGAAYQADKSTISRWISKSRQQLLQRTRDDLGERLHLDTGELDSLMNLVDSQLEMSIDSVLRTRGS